MQTTIITVPGTLVAGYRVASQPSRDYPYGTIDRQKPFFKALGLDLEPFYSGTLNISIAPLTFEMVAPAITFPHVEWTDLHPPEDFSFSPCKVCFVGERYSGYVYYPHPETKKRHYQQASLIEVLAELIPGLKYGDQLELELLASEIRIKGPEK